MIRSEDSIPERSSNDPALAPDEQYQLQLEELNHWDPRSKERGKSGASVHNQILDEIKRSVPLGVETHRTYHYLIPLEEGVLDLYVMRAYVPAEKETDLKRWELEFEQKHNATLVINRSSVRSNIDQQVKEWARGRELLNKTDLAKVEASIQSIFGREPKLEASDYESFSKTLATLPPRTQMKLYAIDPTTTKDREDLIGAERVRDSRDIKLTVAIIDATSFVAAGDTHDQYAQRIGRSIYGSTMRIPTLGTEAAFTLANFAKDEERPAIMVEMVVDPSGQIKSTEVSRAKVVNHGSISPDAIDSVIAERSSRGQNLALVKEAARRLRHARTRDHSIIRTENGEDGPDIVAEAMIASKSELARFAISHGANSIFKVHTPPTEELKQHFVNDMAKIGFQADTSDFDTTAGLARLITRLEEVGSLEANRTLTEILDAFLLRSRFDTENLGHYGVGKDAYMDIKPREATGLANQYQIRAALDRNYTPLKLEELNQRADKRNQQKAENDTLEYKLRFMERVKESLALEGQQFSAEVVRIKKGMALVEIPEFSRWGVVPLRKDRNREWLENGDRVRVKICGFNVNEMRFQFELVSSSTAQRRL